MTTPSPTPTHGRLCILAAALLWSLSGAFTKALTTATFLDVHVPTIESLELVGKNVPIQIAFYRALFAGLVLVPTLRRGDIRFRPMMLAMLLCFALMNAAFITAQALGTAANAILLQNSAPLWMYLVSIYWLGEKPDRRGSISLFIGMLGIGIIIAGGWTGGELLVVGIGLFSGLTYAGVILGLRALRDVPSNWLTVWNHVLGSLVLLPFVVLLHAPTWQQFLVLFLFGSIQLGFPYWLMARGLRSVSAPEAGALTLLEPILTPVWTYLIAGEMPEIGTFLGGAVILAALAYRYFPGVMPKGERSEPVE
ncbi:MAG: DMT family transporter [Planctomycetes bacterium]|jgi:drug/metabolite transporter (DMT)-like permease|nr:DMT family transporter [Planctomycetota bacterium]